MRVQVVGTFGASANPPFEIGSGQVVRVGRDAAQAEIAVPDDFLSRVHFQIGCSAAECRVQNIGSNGITLDGRVVQEAVVGDGSLIQAGRTNFTVRVMEGPLLGILRGQALPLYAILDAARSPQVRERLYASGERFQSLYEGEKGAALDRVAPFLVALPSQSRFLESLAHEAWGRSWGVYVTSRIDPNALRRHFRRFLLVKDENQRQLCFRYYDPRVLRVFLPASTPAEMAEFFGPVDSFLMESDDGKALLRFRMSGDGLIEEKVPLSG